MTEQLDLLSARRCRVPAKDTQHLTLLKAFQRGEKLTVGVALSKYGVYALSQRVGDLKRRYGWPVQSRMVKTNGGAVIAEYWLNGYNV